MEHKEASDILINLLNKNLLGAKEKQAILTAIGVLAWTSLSKSKIKAMRDKREKFKNRESPHKKNYTYENHHLRQYGFYSGNGSRG